MKQFMYFENTEGGMDVFQVSGTPRMFPYLEGWMDEDCFEEDSKLLKWTEQAEIGEFCEHRLGFLVRLKDT